jgi:hypothetical protein
MDIIGHSSNSCNVFLDGIKASEMIDEVCDQFRLDILGETIARTTPYLYPFIIEFALIGASVMFVMSNHIGKK